VKNALKIISKSLKEIKIVVSGAGAAGIACVNLLAKAGATHIVTLDSKGAIHSGREDLNTYKQAICRLNKNQESGSLSDVIKGADLFIGVSQPNILSATDVESMNSDPLVFALSNPNPEITPEEARK
jgi:malate dehydrogenase (oxaloacetate-decarboxylating)